MSKPLFIHIGYHKTATTWFQNQVFNNHPQLEYLGKAYPDHPSFRMSELKEHIISAPDTVFSVSDTQDLLSSILDDHPLNGSTLYGMSYEGLSAGDNWFGGRNFYVADRLKSVFEDFDVKILVGIREQTSMVESMYSEYVKLGGSESLERLLFSPFSEADDLLEKLKYAPVIDHYKDRFGANNVKVYLFERFKQDKQKVLEDICDFLGITVPDLQDETTSKKSNPRLSRFGLGSMRLANHFFFGPLNNLSPVTIGSHYLAKLLRSIGYKKDVIEENSKRDYEAAHRFEQDKRLQNKLRHHVNEAIKTLDKSLFQGRGEFRYELEDELESYLKDYYEEANSKLNDTVSTDLNTYGYPTSGC
ncbi:MAG: hypothetical protein ABEK50_03455 [bacterium]